MKKKTLIAFLSLIFLFVWLLPVYAEKPINPPDVQLPEQAGIYDVPGRPNLKLRVFVHNAKPTPPPSICSDLNDGPTVDPAGWHLPGGTWPYYLNTDSVPLAVGSDNLSTIATDAFGRWSTASSGKINFLQTGLTSANRAKLDNQNIITWGRAPGTALGVTYIWYYTSGPDTGLAVEMDTIMNQKFTWSWTPYPGTNLCGFRNTYDAQDILTHELGHWVGLDDEYTSEYVDNTMYGYGAKAEIKKDTLTTGDVAGAALIYK